jgi:glucose/mannose transport system permease protein
MTNMNQAIKSQTKTPSPTMSTGRIGLYILLVALAVFYLIPVYVAINTSLKSFEEVSKSSAFSLVQNPSLSSYLEAFTGLQKGLFNSLAMAIPATIISSLLGSMNGYILAKWKFKGADTIFPAVLFGMFIPYQAILIPLFQFMSDIKLAGSIWALILVHVVYGIPITSLIFRNFYATIPNSLLEASKLDGASFFGIYRYVLFPLSTSSFVVVLIWQFTNIWNDFLFAVTLTSPATQPVTVVLQGLGAGQINHYEVQMAGAIVAALPTLLIYIVLGRYFVQGVLAGSVKG